MRSWLYNRVKNIQNWPTYFSQDRVISSGSADQPVAPFLIISMGVEQPPLGLPASTRTQRIPFTVWVHDKPGSMLKIDDMAVALKDGLPTMDNLMVGGMSVYNLEWVETGADAFDDHFKTNTRPVRFTMMTRR